MLIYLFKTSIEILKLRLTEMYVRNCLSVDSSHGVSISDVEGLGSATGVDHV
jgi:hypothetical protein